MRRPILLAVLLLALVACGDDDPPVVTDTTTTTAAEEAGALHVEPDGLLVDAEPLPFGSEGAAAVDVVGGVLGAPDEQAEQPECPPGPATVARFGDIGSGLLLTIQDGSLVGWSIAAGSTLTTSAGIGIGSTRAEVEAAYGPLEVIPDSTLGVEVFVEGGISALLSEDGPDGAVTALWAGANCIFR